MKANTDTGRKVAETCYDLVNKNCFVLYQTSLNICNIEYFSNISVWDIDLIRNTLISLSTSTLSSLVCSGDDEDVMLFSNDAVSVLTCRAEQSQPS